MVTLREEVKEYALTTLEMDQVGIAGVDRLSGAPQGYRPVDLLPGAKSVIVMAVRLPLGAVQAIYRAHEDGLRHAQCIYGTHGYALTPNYHLKFAAYRMARFLEKKGLVATPLPSGPGSGGVPFSHRHAAVAAGLGEFGWSGIVVTPDYGPRVRFVSVITRAELDPDPLYSGPSLCDRCDICVDMCPVGAIDPVESRSVEMGGRIYEYGKVHYAKCRVGTEGLTTKSLGFKDLPIPEDPTWEDVDIARRDIDKRQLSEAILPVDRATWYCGRCLAYCPIGSDREMHMLEGLSSC
ncbi:MAG: 4Fe-4S binding protein [Thermoleophilia bacterium]|nr:4Fe-4S binding protein [Thermoleophilia bacterium]